MKKIEITKSYLVEDKLADMLVDNIDSYLKMMQQHFDLLEILEEKEIDE